MEIWTLMSGFPGEQELSDFAREMHTQWGTSTPDQTVALRRSEDKRAAAKVGAHPVHFDFFDCIYRKDAELQPLYSDAMYTPLHPVDAGLPARIAGALRQRLRDDDVLICQLGIGEHVDHLLARSGAELLQRPLLYDADIPYLLNHPDELGPRTASMAGALQPVSREGFSTWLEAIQEYRSQLSTLFDSMDALRDRMHSYWSEESGILLWSRRPAVAGAN